MSTTPTAPAPITHRIADKAPEFPCWLYHRIFGWEFTRRPWHLTQEDTHWCHSAERPTHAPESQAQGPSDSEMLDRLDGLTVEQAVAVINSQSKNLPTVRAAIASAMKGTKL